MKKIFSAVCLIASLLCSQAYGAPWAFVANHLDRNIKSIDLGTNPPTVYGPFLGGQLGTTGALGDLAITPDNRYAVLSNFGACALYRIDLTNPTNPNLAGSISLPTITGAPAPGCYTPLDIAIAPNGQFAILSDGRSLLMPPQSPTNMIGIIDLTSFTYTTTYTLTTPNGSAQAVAIAADNQTVIIADRAGGISGCQTTPAPPTPNSCGRIIYGVINPSAGLVSESQIVIGNNSFPINVTISPDGRTALVSDATTSVKVFEITAPGTVVPGATPTVTGLPGRQQSIAFSPDGLEAYALSTTPSPHQLSWLQINGPGNVTLGGAGVAALLTSGNANRVMGVDVIAVTPDGGYALIGNPSLPGDTTSPNMSLVNLSTFAVSTVTTNSNYPMGDGIIPGIAVIFTSPVSVVSSNTAAGGGNITSDRGIPVTQRGVCWSTSPNPTTADTCTNDGTGTGSFTSSLTGLTPGLKYHARAYATNAAGTAYGDDVVFWTAYPSPTMTEWGMILLAVLLGIGAWYQFRRKRREA